MPVLVVGMIAELPRRTDLVRAVVAEYPLKDRRRLSLRIICSEEFQRPGAPVENDGAEPYLPPAGSCPEFGGAMASSALSGMLSVFSPRATVRGDKKKNARNAAPATNTASRAAIPSFIITLYYVFGTFLLSRGRI